MDQSRRNPLQKMKIDLIALGKGAPSWVNSGFQDYAKRLSGPIKLNLIEIPTPKRSKTTSIEKLKIEEAKLILEFIPEKQFTIALDERGILWNTEDLSKHLKQWEENYQNISMIIGGPDGLEKSIRDRANLIWSLSPLTLPHALVRILVAEQIYRAHSLSIGHPYHRN